jgi:hypothetical protein
VTPLKALFLFCSLVAAAVAPPAPDLAAINSAASATEKKLTTDPASWTTTIIQPDGRNVIVETLKAGDNIRQTFSVMSKGEKLEIAKVIQRDGFWYVREFDLARKYRPYECPFIPPSVPVLSHYAELLLASTDITRTFGGFQGTTGENATFNQPLQPAFRQAVEGIKQQIDGVRQQSPNHTLEPAVEEKFNLLQELLKSGSSFQVDLKNGLIIEQLTPQFHLKVSDFHWVASVPPMSFQPQM